MSCRRIGLLCAGLVLPVYLGTILPTVGWGDSGDLALAAVTMGVPHPSGYPLYTLLGKLFTYLPVGTIPWRLGLFSALCASGTVGLFAALLLRYTGCAPGAFVTALAFAFSLTFWEGAITIEVYALHLLLLLLVATLVAGGARGRIVACLLGLGFAHHLTILFLLPAFLGWFGVSRFVSCSGGEGTCRPVSLRRGNLRISLGVVAAFLAPLALYLWLPLAAALDRPHLWGDLTTLGGVFDQITGTMYHRRWSGFSLPVLGANLERYGHDLLRQLTPFGVLAASWGGISLLWRGEKWRLLLLAALFLPPLLYASNFTIDDIEAYHLVPNGVLFFCAGVGIASVFPRGGKWRRLCFALALSWPAWLAIRNGVLLSGLDDTAALYGEEVTQEAPEGALILVNGDGPTFVLWYYAAVEHPRPDLAIVNLNLLTFGWYRRRVSERFPELTFGPPPPSLTEEAAELIERNIDRVPLFTSGVFRNPAWPTRFPAAFEAHPFGHLWRITRRAGASALPDLVIDYRIGLPPDAGPGRLKRRFVFGEDVLLRLHLARPRLLQCRWIWEGGRDRAPIHTEAATRLSHDVAQCFLPAVRSMGRGGRWFVEVTEGGKRAAFIPFRIEAGAQGSTPSRHAKVHKASSPSGSRPVRKGPPAPIDESPPGVARPRFRAEPGFPPESSRRESPRNRSGIEFRE